MKKITLASIAAAILAIYNINAASVSLAWDANAATDQVTKYSVYQATGLTGSFVKVADVTSGTSYTINNITPGVYRFYVTASNVWKESSPSNTVITPDVPATPVGLRLNIL